MEPQLGQCLGHIKGAWKSQVKPQEPRGETAGGLAIQTKRKRKHIPPDKLAKLHSLGLELLDVRPLSTSYPACGLLGSEF
jgi:hypothetical protein